MLLRKLGPDENERTRKLWEEVFHEDTEAFLDYYYSLKTRDNEILVIEEEGQICSMLHLNPYRVRIADSEADSAYIVAVATKQEYRKRGFMGALLRAAMDEMYKKGMPFAFLMPAAEAIYTPYDFRYIYDQPRGELKKSGNRLFWNGAVHREKDLQEESAFQTMEFRDAGIMDGKAMAEFYNGSFSGRYQVCTVRDAWYYQVLVAEQQSENGGMRLMKKDGKICGMYAYAWEGKPEIREPLFLQGYEDAFLYSAEELYERGRVCKNGAEQKGNSDCEIPVYGCAEDRSSGKKPLIMARIISVRKMLSFLSVPEETELDCSFAVIDPLIKKNSGVWKLTSSAGGTEVKVREAEDSEGVIPVAELTEFLFGRIGTGELRNRDNVILSDRLVQELEKVDRFAKVCFNEVV